MEASQTNDVDLLVGFEQRLNWWQNIVYAVQQLTADTTVLVIPLLLARAMQFPPEMSAYVVQATLVGSGVVTIGQALWILKLPVLQGPAIVFAAVVPAVAAVSSPAAAWTGMVLASLIAALLSGVGFWGKARVVLGSAPVYGVVMLLVCYTIAGAIAGQVAGFPNAPTFGQPFNFVMASIPFAVAIVVVLLLRSTKLRLISLLLGAIAAILVAVIADKMSFAAVARAPWIGLSVLFPFGFQFDVGATLVMLIAFIADLGQVVGCYLMVGETIGKEKLSNKRIDGGIFTESIGSALSGAFGGMPTVTYSQNIGAILVTGVGSRFIFATAGVILLILGLCPKVGAVVAAIPGPIVGGLLFVAIVMLTMQSIRVLGMMPHTSANILTAGGAIMIGFIAAALPRELIAMLPAIVRPFVASGVIMGFLAAAVMHTIFNLILKRSEAEEQQPAQA